MAEKDSYSYYYHNPPSLIEKRYKSVYIIKVFIYKTKNKLSTGLPGGHAWDRLILYSKKSVGTTEL